MIAFAKRQTYKQHFTIIKKYRSNEEPVQSVWTEKEIHTDKGTLQLKAISETFHNQDYLT